MSGDALKALLTAMDFAAFERTAEGSFVALTQAPPWFPRLATGTFPFLGHILDEANAFWLGGQSGRQDWGPAAETGEDGREFHYMISALTIDGRQYLVFQLDRASERLRDVLQIARDHQLQNDREHKGRRPFIDTIDQRSGELYSVLEQLKTGPQAAGQRELFEKLSSACDAIVAAASRLS